MCGFIDWWSYKSMLRRSWVAGIIVYFFTNLKRILNMKFYIYK